MFEDKFGTPNKEDEVRSLVTTPTLCRLQSCSGIDSSSSSKTPLRDWGREEGRWYLQCGPTNRNCVNDNSRLKSYWTTSQPDLCNWEVKKVGWIRPWILLKAQEYSCCYCLDLRSPQRAVFLCQDLSRKRFIIRGKIQLWLFLSSDSALTLKNHYRIEEANQNWV